MFVVISHRRQRIQSRDSKNVPKIVSNYDVVPQSVEMLCDNLFQLSYNFASVVPKAQGFKMWSLKRGSSAPTTPSSHRNHGLEATRSTWRHVDSTPSNSGCRSII